MSFVNNFPAPTVKSDCHQTSSVIPLARGDEVIKFWNVKVGGGGICALLNALLVGFMKP